MKKRLLFFLTMAGMLVSTSISCMAFPPKGKQVSATFVPDSAMCARLGNTVADVLFNPSKIVCYRVKGKTEVGKDDYVLEPHYVRDTEIGTLSSKLLPVLPFILTTDEASYSRDTILVRSPYMPQLEFEFFKKNVTAHVLISLSDYSWTLVYDGKKQFNYNYQDKRAIARFCDMIMKQEEEKK